MNENLNLCEILKDVPAGTMLWSPMIGKVAFVGISDNRGYPIEVTSECFLTVHFTSDGRYHKDVTDGECMLFPSKDQRDWSLFKVVKKLKQKVTLFPFARVLVRSDDEDAWTASLLSNIIDDDDYPYITVSGVIYDQCIPYNVNTYNLLGTDADCPIDYEIAFDKSYTTPFSSH